MKRSLKNFRNNFIKASALAIAVLLISASVIQVALGKGNGDYEDAGSGSYDSRACSSGICWSLRKRGAFWVKIPVSSNGIHASELGFDYVFRNDTIDCYNESTGRGAVYVLSTRLSNGGIAGMVNIDSVTSMGSLNDGDGMSAPGEIVPEATAHNKFNENADGYWNNHQQRYSGTGLSYFCAEMESVSSRRTTTVPDGTRKLKCNGVVMNEKGNTVTRIAVQNMSVDGAYNPTDSAGNSITWKGRGNTRSNIHSDSGWTMGSDEGVYTIAKPGDSIRFYHGVCMGVRYGKWTPTQNTWTGPEEHTKEYTPLPANWMRIYALPSNYVFDNKSVWNNFQSKVANVTAHKNLFTSSAGAGSIINSDKNAIDLINPTPGLGTYTCNEISWYASENPFIVGGYHIPGFKSGHCSSASKTGISQATGTVIEQGHEYNSLRMWEVKSHTVDGTCSCGVNSARLVANYDDNTFESAWRGSSYGNRKEYKCVNKTTKDCDYICTARDEYNNCTAGYYNKIDYPFTDDSDKHMYHSTHYSEDAAKKARVYVPYNFNTSVYSSIDAGDVVFQGSAISDHFEWSVDSRVNEVTAPGWSSKGGYATSTPGSTQVVMFEWIYKPGNRKVVGNSFTSQTPQSYYSSGMVSGTYHVIETKTGDQNPTGNYRGADYSANYTRTIPDNGEYVGYKYCSAIAFYPADSHDGGGNTINQQKSTGYKGAMDGGQYWNISGASCRTIGKKPNLQVWNGSIYTEGNINTSISRKKVNAGMGAYDGSGVSVFGSWTDYAIVAGGTNKTMASGAMLGYNNAFYNLRGEGGKPAGSTSAQKLNPETTANNTNPTGNSGVHADASYIQNLNRLNSRYKEKTKTLLSEIGITSPGKKIYTTTTGMQVANVSGSVSISELGISKQSSHPNKDTVSNTDAGGLVKSLGDGKNDNTLVIVSSGTVTINRNICYGSCGSDATKLSSYKYNTTGGTKAAAEIPQILIFAKNINIAENVTRVDAWLMATGSDGLGTTDGTLNTCAGHRIGADKDGKIGLVARDANTPAYDNGNCGLTLVINGPVYAHHINALRTAGAFHGYANTSGIDVLSRSVGATGVGDANKGSVTPAEIFNLRADTYIWAYNQAPRYSEAVVTYTRELAPRD